MRLHKILLATALLLLCARTTHAEHLKVGLLLDGVVGATVPIGDSDFKKFADASFKIGIRGGAVLYLSDRFGIAPEAEFDFIPLMPDNTDFPSSSGTVSVSTSIFEERLMFGARYIIAFGIGSFYLRTMIGMDHIGGTTRGSIGGISGSTDFSSTAFSLEPGAGIQFNIIKHLVVGFTTGFPIAFHDFGNNNRKFTAVDVDFLAVAGFRL